MLHRITTQGAPRFSPPQNRFINGNSLVPEQIVRGTSVTPQEWEFELAGPLANLFCDPKRRRAGIVTCGGLCLGMNSVIRSLFNELFASRGKPMDPAGPVWRGTLAATGQPGQL